MRDLKVHRVSTNPEVKLQRAWMEGELKERAMAAQVHQAEGRMGALEVDLAAQVQRAEGSMSELASELELAAAQAQENSWAEQYTLQEQQRENRMGILEGDLKGLVTGEQLQQVEEQMGELDA